MGPQMGEFGVNLQTAIRAVIELILGGKVPQGVCQVLHGAALTALKKKTGGIRPIAVGNVWRRLAAKVVVQRVTPALADFFSPQQVGVGKRGGAEAGAHAARIFCGAPHSTQKAFLKLDFRNAFNEVRRDHMLGVVAQKFPQFSPFLWQCYAAPTELFWGETSIPSLLGAQQGDPLGPALFSMAIHHIVVAMETEFNLWYLDDATLGDEPEKVLASLRLVQQMGEKVGLHLNSSKCEVGFLQCDGETSARWLEEFRGAAPGIREISTESATLLGAPLTYEAAELVLEEKTRFLSFLGGGSRGGKPCEYVRPGE